MAVIVRDVVLEAVPCGSTFRTTPCPMQLAQLRTASPNGETRLRALFDLLGRDFAPKPSATPIATHYGAPQEHTLLGRRHRLHLSVLVCADPQNTKFRDADRDSEQASERQTWRLEP
jgi:hypothetical protein